MANAAPNEWFIVVALRIFDTAIPARQLRISVEPAFAARWLVPRFGGFTAAHPDIEVDLATGRNTPRARHRVDADVLAYRLLHDDDGSAWRRWFAVTCLTDYNQIKHLHFNDYSLVLTAALRGQGVALSAPFYVSSQLRSGRLMRIGRTPVQFGEYWMMQAGYRRRIPHKGMGTESSGPSLISGSPQMPCIVCRRNRLATRVL